ncbi:MAG TPA: 1-phosphofructokinase family hexose kinase [Miltoncostaeaceae bacterium]|nr:1-phosphofructokinase family hexose kinase [Miltoncostaeaceae bacterium]
MSRIVTLTINPALDASTEVPALVAGPKLRCGPVRREAGGGGINVARAITALGEAALALHAVGGPPGAMIESCLAEEGVPQRPVRVSGMPRENLAVLDRSSGERFRFVLPGPPMTRAEWRRCLDEAVAAADGPYLVASGSLPPGVPADFYARLATALAASGTRLLLDCCGAPLRAALARGVHLIKPNYREFDELAGRELTDAERERSAARLVEEGRAEVVIVTLGPRGALLVSGTERARIAAPSVPPAGSPVGAGDSFMGALAVALAAGRRLVDACAYGVAAAAAAMMTPGTEPCRRADVEALAARMDARTARAGESTETPEVLR